MIPDSFTVGAWLSPKKNGGVPCSLELVALGANYAAATLGRVYAEAAELGVSEERVARLVRFHTMVYRGVNGYPDLHGLVGDDSKALAYLDYVVGRSGYVAEHARRDLATIAHYVRGDV